MRSRATPHRSFNVYVTQPEVKPGCVLRRSNWSVLEGRKLVDDTQARSALLASAVSRRTPAAVSSAAHLTRARAPQVNDCKRHMNTFAFVGNLEDSPEVSCVYHSEQARVHAARVLPPCPAPNSRAVRRQRTSTCVTRSQRYWATASRIASKTRIATLISMHNAWTRRAVKCYVAGCPIYKLYGRNPNCTPRLGRSCSFARSVTQ